MSGAIPIKFRRMVGRSGTPPIARIPENNNETFLTGVPIAIESGYASELSEANNNNHFVGFSLEYGKNRATDGTAETIKFGSVLNQANAVLTPVGAPMDDGNVGVILASAGVRFEGALGTANNLAQTMVGAVMGLVKDSNNYWYLDDSKTAAGNGYVRVTELIDDVGDAYGRVEFEVLQAHVDFPS